VPNVPFQLPLWLDLSAVGLFSVTGAMAAREKRYDLVGALTLALAVGLGGALLRDGLFLQAGPPAALRDGRYLLAVLVGAGVGIYFASHLHRLRLVIELADAAGLGIYAVYGAERALLAGLPVLSAILVGAVNAVGGSVLRDVLTREEPLLFKPGQFYALAALGGGAVFAVLWVPAAQPSSVAAGLGIAVAFGLRVGSIRLGWRTGALSPDRPDPTDPA
jgi:uncharacterized membrane protein YeiH